MKPIRQRAGLLLAALVLPLLAAGQDDASASANEADKQAEPSKPISARDARREMWRAEKEFYQLYNRLNEDRDFDVFCSKDAATGRTIKEQTCRPVFVDEAIRDGKIHSPAGLKTKPELLDKFEIFRVNIDRLTNSNPDLRAAAIALNESRAQYAAAKEAGK